MPNALVELADYIAIQRLQASYADIVTRRAWPELHGIFRPEIFVVIDKRDGSVLELNGPDEIGGFIGDSLRQFSFFEFVILNSVVELYPNGNPDTATARLYMSELRLEEVDGRFTKVFGLYQDHYCRIDGRWWFDGRWYGTLARSAAPGSRAELHTFPFPTLPENLVP